MPPFIDNALHWALMTAGHFLIMFWWLWLGAVVLTAVSETWIIDRWEQRLIENPDNGWRTIAISALLGVLSPPSRARIFRRAQALLAGGVAPTGVLAYIVSAQSVLIWMLFLIVMLNGLQPVIGQLVAVAAVLVAIRYALRWTPRRLWDAARRRAGDELGERVAAGLPGPAALRFLKSLAGQAYSLWWPLLFGTLGIGFFLALGQSPGYLSLQGSRGPLLQLANAALGLVLAYGTSAPLVGNALFAAGLWKPEFVTYAGLSAFYLGTLVMPFVLPRYFALFGVDLGRRVALLLVVAIIVAALAVTAWWWGLDWLAGLLGVRDWFESFTASTLRPSSVPWFHHWFAPGL